MSRGLGAVELVGELLSDIAVIPIAHDATGHVVVLFAVVYWRPDRTSTIQFRGIEPASLSGTDCSNHGETYINCNHVSVLTHAA